MDMGLLTLTDWLELGTVHMTSTPDMRELWVELLHEQGLRSVSPTELRGHFHELSTSELCDLVTAAGRYGPACVRSTWGALLSGARADVVTDILRLVQTRQFILPGQRQRKARIPQRTGLALASNPRVTADQVKELVDEGTLPDYALDEARKWDKASAVAGQLSTSMLKFTSAASAIFTQYPGDASQQRLFFELVLRGGLEPRQASELAVAATQ